METESVIQPIREILEHARSQGKPDEITLRHTLNESWFSDALAWLLDPHGSHELGDAFLSGFVNAIATRRPEPDPLFAKLLADLKLRQFRRPGDKRLLSMRLENATALREFYLPAIVSRRKNQRSRYADVVVFDLDPDDGLFLVVENKLFGANHRGQLLDQYEAVEQKYATVPICKYVYLTLSGDRPNSRSTAERRILEHWTCLSWTTDVLGILEGIAQEPGPRLMELITLLRWLRRLIEASASRQGAVRELEQAFVDVGVFCLKEELVRLGEGKPGSWEITSTGHRSARLKHSAAPKRALTISMLANCSLAIQSKYRNKALCEKILIPFGASPDQTTHLLQLTARDIYGIHFNKPDAFFSQRAELERSGNAAPAVDCFLKFIWEHHFELGALLCVSRGEAMAP